MNEFLIDYVWIKSTMCRSEKKYEFPLKIVHLTLNNFANNYFDLLKVKVVLDTRVSHKKH